MQMFPLPQGSYPIGKLGTIGGWGISSYFGGRPNPFTGQPSYHGGMDFPCPNGTPLYAPVDGVVQQSWDGSGGGNWTSILGDDGRRYGMGHAREFVGGHNGHHVPAGTLVAYANSTGASTGSHLHFAMALSHWGPWQDPFDDLVACAAAGHFVGAHPAPSEPLPEPETIPVTPPPEPRKALITMQYWKIDGEDAIYKVDSAPYLSPHAVARDNGEEQNSNHFVGGVYAIKFDSAATLTLEAGIGVEAVVLKRGERDDLIDELENRIPWIDQAR